MERVENVCALLSEGRKETKIHSQSYRGSTRNGPRTQHWCQKWDPNLYTMPPKKQTKYAESPDQMQEELDSLRGALELANLLAEEAVRQREEADTSILAAYAN